VGDGASHVSTSLLHTSKERLRIARITQGNKAELDALREIVQLEPVQIREHALLRESLRKLSPPRDGNLVKCAGAPSTPRDLREQELAVRFARSLSPEKIMVRSVSPTETCSLLRLVSQQIDNVEEHSLKAALEWTGYVFQGDLPHVSQVDLPQAQRTSLSPGRSGIDTVVATLRPHTPTLSSAPKTPSSSMPIASSQHSVILEAQIEQGVSPRGTRYTSRYTSSKRLHTSPLGRALLQCSRSVALKDVGSWTLMERELREKIVSGESELLLVDLLRDSDGGLGIVYRRNDASFGPYLVFNMIPGSPSYMSICHVYVLYSYILYS
jgi:hypothetical protein